MHPLYFGSSRKRLFGVYHPPRGTGTVSGGVVLCYPFGQEYMRSHRAFRQLALLLAGYGLHVFRFDYYGTGDSAGRAEEGTVEQWRQDVAAAVQELRDTAGLDRVDLVGLRLGGALAAGTAAERDDVDRLVLWDPVIHGAAYVEELLEAAGPAAGNGEVPDTVGVLGFPLTPALRTAIERIDLTALQPTWSTTLVVTSREGAAAPLEESWGEAPGVRYRCIPTPGNWNEVDNYGGVLLPQRIIQSIVAWLTGADDD